MAIPPTASSWARSDDCQSDVRKSIVEKWQTHVEGRRFALNGSIEGVCDLSLHREGHREMDCRRRCKNMQTGATYGVKPIAARCDGELPGNGNILRFVGDNGSAILEFPLPSSNKMEGRATFKDGNGRVFLTKQ